MYEQAWDTKAIADCLTHAFAGEWGGEPTPANAIVLRATDIDNDGHVTGEGAQRAISASKLKIKQLQDGDILLEGSGGSPDNPVGRAALFEARSQVQPALCSNFFKTLRPNREIVDPRFLWRKLCWFYRQPQLLSMQQQTTGIINLKFQDYLAAQISLPLARSEQSKVAEVLDTLDTTIRQTEAIIAKLKQVKQALLHDLLTRGIDANGELRPSQSEAPPQWRIESMGMLMDGAPRNGIYKPARDIGAGTLLIGQTAFTSSGSVDASLARRARLTMAEQEMFGLRREDLLVSRVFATREGVGQPVLVPEFGEPAVFESNMMRVRCSADLIRAPYLFHWLKHRTSRAWLMSHAFASNQASINRETLCGVPVHLPPLHEQDQILSIISAEDARLACEVEEMTKLKQLKSGLMDDLLTGHVRVTPLLKQEATA